MYAVTLRIYFINQLFTNDVFFKLFSSLLPSFFYIFTECVFQSSSHLLSDWSLNIKLQIKTEAHHGLQLLHLTFKRSHLSRHGSICLSIDCYSCSGTYYRHLIAEWLINRTDSKLREIVSSDARIRQGLNELLNLFSISASLRLQVLL